MRIKPILLTLCLIGIWGVSYAQKPKNIAYLMSDTSFTCEEISKHTLWLIPTYYQKSALDSIDLILYYWERECGISEQIIRLKILSAIEQNQFSESVFDSSIVDDLIYYKRKSLCENDFFHFNNHYYDSKTDTLDGISLDWAKRLSKTSLHSPTERFFVNMYAQDFTNQLGSLSNKTFNETKLQDGYQKKIQSIGHPVLGKFDFLFGAWVPEDNIAVLGTSFSMGVRAGMVYQKIITEFALDLRFGKSQEKFKIVDYGGVWYKDKFMGGYLGINAGYNFIHTKRNRLSLMFGIGVDFTDIILEKPENDDEEILSKTLYALNLNTGLSYRFMIDAWSYVGFETKYNRLNYNNKKGTSLSGNAITISLLFGIVPYDTQYEDLIELDYYE